MFRLSNPKVNAPVLKPCNQDVTNFLSVGVHAVERLKWDIN